jgi:hypothetical protein
MVEERLIAQLHRAHIIACLIISHAIPFFSGRPFRLLICPRPGGWF